MNGYKDGLPATPGPGAHETPGPPQRRGSTCRMSVLCDEHPREDSAFIIVDSERDVRRLTFGELSLDHLRGELWLTRQAARPVAVDCHGRRGSTAGDA